jgi:hypothetical protein
MDLLNKIWGACVMVLIWVSLLALFLAANPFA